LGTKRPLIIAHRGASHEAPENTLAAIKLAWQEQADAVEIDVHLSRDGQIVVLHDSNTWRLGRWPFPVKWQSLAMLKRLDAGKYLAGGKYAGERIPTLPEVLKLIPPDKSLIIEIKCGTEILAPIRYKLLRSNLTPRQAQFISFHEEVIAGVKQQMPQYAAQMLYEFRRDKRSQRWLPDADEIIKSAGRTKADGVGLMACGALDEKLVKRLREQELGFYVWTVNDADSARRVIELGADGITTDRPMWLRNTIAQSI